MNKDVKTETKLVRVLPTVLEEAIAYDFNITINKSGYLIGGFYGLNPKSTGLLMDDSYLGHVLLIETDNENGLIGFDHKGKKHLITNFEDLVRLNHHVWKNFIKDPQYRTVNSQWFKHLYDRGLLEINPKK